MSEFDPYHQWLGIPVKERPISKYRLLGLATFENDKDVITAAAERQTVYLRMIKTAQHAKLATQILNEVSEARVTLLDSRKKSFYDEKLRKEINALQPMVTQPLSELPDVHVKMVDSKKKSSHDEQFDKVINALTRMMNFSNISRIRILGVLKESVGLILQAVKRSGNRLVPARDTLIILFRLPHRKKGLFVVGSVLLLLIVFARSENSGNKGLLAYYSFNEDSRDLSGNEYNGEVKKGVRPVRSLLLGRAYEFTGVGDSYIEIDNSLGVVFRTRFSIGAWIKINDEAAAEANVILGQGKYKGSLFYFRIVAGRVEINLYGERKGGGTTLETQSILSRKVLESNRWYHVVGIRDGRDMQIYIDGELDSEKQSQVDVRPNLAGPVLIGRVDGPKDHPRSNCMNGCIDELLIFNRQLAPIEVVTIYEYGVSTLLTVRSHSSNSNTLNPQQKKDP